MTKMIQLLHVFATFMPGGPQVRTCMIINSLPKYFHHTIISMDQKIEAQNLIEDWVNVSYLTKGINGSSFSNILKLAKIIRLKGPNIILTYNWGAIDAIIAAKIYNFKKIIHAEEGFRPDEAKGTQKKRRVLARRFLLPYVSKVVVPSLNLKNIAESTWRIPSNKICYLPNSVDCDHFSPGRAYQARRALGIGDEDCVVGTVAHLRMEKNLDMLISAFANIGPKYAPHLLIVGDGPEKGNLLNLTKKIGVKDRVHFLGHYKDPAVCYQMMDIFALSSKTEQMPISVLEAMATGLPILSTDVGDIRIMVDDENRPFIIPQENESFFKAALEKLIIHKEKRIYLGIKNRKTCLRDYQHDKMIIAYQNLYEQVLSS